MGCDKVFNLGHPLGGNTLDILPKCDLVDVGVGDVACGVVVAADNRCVHTVAFGYIKD